MATALFDRLEVINACKEGINIYMSKRDEIINSEYKKYVEANKKPIEGRFFGFLPIKTHVRGMTTEELNLVFYQGIEPENGIVKKRCEAANGRFSLVYGLDAKVGIGKTYEFHRRWSPTFTGGRDTTGMFPVYKKYAEATNKLHKEEIRKLSRMLQHAENTNSSMIELTDYDFKFIRFWYNKGKIGSYPYDHSE